MSKNQKKENKEYANKHNLAEDSISLADIFLIFARDFKIIVFVPTVFCIITIIYALYFTTPVFKSTSKFMSSSGTSGVSQASGLAAQFGIELPLDQSQQKWVYPEIIKSRSLARSMLKRRFDTNKFGPQKQLLQIFTYGNGNPQSSQDILEIKAVDRLLEMISVSENIKTGIITLSIFSSESQLAAEINQALIEELDSYQRRYNKAKTINTKHFIEGRIQDTEKELVAAEENLKIFRDRNRRIENSPALQLEQQRLGREVSVLTGVFTTLKQQLETTKIEEVKESDYVIVVDPPEIPLSRSKPNKKNMVVLSGFLGLGLGFLFSLLREFFSRIDNIEKDKLFEGLNYIIETVIEFFPFLRRFFDYVKK